ncbi:hypothetical protein [Marinagarivorans cellulosilyticus]|uniref:hypothetical protein n=1 Tax=Marinagarivorans cellulosilyticus TaxID=2721545 RepID=UPI001F33C1C7|nr:hypothetical protein [Marinagarivorans cellulosilyticus]
MSQQYDFEELNGQEYFHAPLPKWRKLLRCIGWVSVWFVMAFIWRAFLDYSL